MAQDVAMLILREQNGTREWPIEGEIVIGRDANCEVHLPDRQVSRRHAVVRRERTEYRLEDAGSKNGLWLNGTPVDGFALLNDGDEISVAARFKLYFVDAEATAPLVFEDRGIRVDHDAMCVWVNGTEVSPPLSGPQYELLRVLYASVGNLIKRDEIIAAVWPEADPGGVSEDALDALVRRLRLRLAEIDDDHQYVVTVRGYGFRLELP